MFKRTCNYLSEQYRFLLTVILISCLPALGHSQQATSEWTLDNTVNGVEFYHSLNVCNGKTVVFLKVRNKNKYPVKVSWDEKFSTQEGSNIKGFFGRKNVSLAKGEVKESTCGSKLNKELAIRPDQVQPTYIADIKKFDFAEVKVTKTI